MRTESVEFSQLPLNSGDQVLGCRGLPTPRTLHRQPPFPPVHEPKCSRKNGRNSGPHAYFGAIRSVVSGESDQLFRLNPIGRFGAIRSP